MHLDKLVTVLKSLDEAQMKRLKAFVSSPYFRIPPVCILLLERLSVFHPRFSEKKMEPQNIGAREPTLSTISKQQNAGSHLLRAVERFVAQEQWEKNEAEIARLQLSGFHELALRDEFDKGLEKQMEKINATCGEGFDAFYEKHLLTELSLNGFGAKLNRSAQNDIMPVVKTLDEFYALKKLRYLCEAINRKQILGLDHPDGHIPYLLKILEPYSNSKYPYAYMFVNVYRMLASDNYKDSDLYYQLIKQFASLHGSTPATREAITYAINHCLYWNNKGYDEAGNEYLWWIKWKMKHKLLLEKGKLMPITFRNVVTAAFTQKNAAQMQKIISVYAPFLPEGHTETNLAFANALYHYSIKQYKKAIRCFLLAQAKEEAIFNSSIRRWQYMCLYEYDPNDTDALDNHLLSFEKYLQRNKKELQHVAGLFETFISYAAKLFKPATAEALNRHWSQLQSEEYFPGNLWLAEQFAAKNKKPVLHKAGRVLS